MSATKKGPPAPPPARRAAKPPGKPGSKSAATLLSTQPQSPHPKSNVNRSSSDPSGPSDSAHRPLPADAALERPAPDFDEDVPKNHEPIEPARAEASASNPDDTDELAPSSIDPMDGEIQEAAFEPVVRGDFDDEDEDSADEDDEPSPSSVADGTAVAARIRELEARLDRMIDESARAHDASRPPPPPPSSHRLLPTDGETTVFDTARELLSTDFYLRKWGRLGMRNRSEEVDDFGYDPVYAQKVQPVFDFLYEKYFRVEIDGVENVPPAGRCLLVANHSGTLPYDGVMLRAAVKREHAAHRDVRWLAEDFIFHFPFLGSISNRIGAVRACQENAERLLRKEALVAVFPEGVKGIGKLFRQRYQLQRFGRGGFIKLCLRTGTPIIPVAVIGAEEANPMIARIEYLSKAMGLPYIPVTPTFPLLGPLGLVPAPTKWKIVFGERLDFDGYGAEAAEDEILVGRLAERVRATIQGMLDRGVGERRSVFFG